MTNRIIPVWGLEPRLDYPTISLSLEERSGSLEERSAGRAA